MIDGLLLAISEAALCLRKVRKHSKIYIRFAFYMLTVNLSSCAIKFLGSSEAQNMLGNVLRLDVLIGILAFLSLFFTFLCIADIVVSLVKVFYRDNKKIPLIDENYLNQSLWLYDFVYILIFFIEPAIMEARKLVG